MDKEQIWEASLARLELSLSKANFATWFENTFIKDIENDEQVTLGVPHAFAKAWLKKKYHKEILESLQDVTEGKIKKIIYEVDLNLHKNEEKPENVKIETDTQKIGINLNQTRYKDSLPMGEFALNEKYTFENFVVGKTNELAYAAAKCVATYPGEKYNPLFLYGDVGIGKTHLSQAIGNEINKRFQGEKVLYITCEKFVNDYIEAIQAGKMKEFRDKYRSYDLLLIDDIQFMAGKDRTQEEFFNTFNEYYQKNKQIVITSDRPPQALSAFQERLTSRLECGMIADISIPDLETRVAIVESKLNQKGYKFKPEVIKYIATMIQKSVRELEGILNKIIAQYELRMIEPTIDNIKTTIFALKESRKKHANFGVLDILKTVSNFYNITDEGLKGKSRKRELVVPRQISMYLLREELDCSFPNIGSELGGRDHTTAMHSYQKIKTQILENNKIQKDIELIREKLYL